MPVTVFPYLEAAGSVVRLHNLGVLETIGGTLQTGIKPYGALVLSCCVSSGSGTLAASQYDGRRDKQPFIVQARCSFIIMLLVDSLCFTYLSMLPPSQVHPYFDR